MQAFVSGQAGVALLVDGERLCSLHADRPDEMVARSQRDIPFLFRNVTDLEVFEGIDIPKATARLELATAKADGLQLALILLDPELTTDTREDAAAELVALLGMTGVTEWIESILYSRSLPDEGDLPGALALCPKTGPVRDLLLRFQARQEEIEAVSRAWDEIPLRLFGSTAERSGALAVAVREGLFRDLALSSSERGTLEQFRLTAYSNRAFGQIRNHRDILREWLSPIHSASPSPKPKLSALEPDEIEEKPHEEEAPRSSREVFKRIAKQKAAILEMLGARNLERARQYLEDLIELQLKVSEPVQVCKTLCDLAKKAKDLGLVRLQLELTSRAVELKNDDGWSWSQHGDALLQSGQLELALEAYDRALVYVNAPSARNGRAEVLKALNRLPDALAAYETVIAGFPENVVARNGRAEVLKALNRLPDALAAYEAVIADFPENGVARTGRAEVLKALNRLPDALAAYEAVIAEFPENVVARSGRAEVLKALNRLPDAFAAYETVIADFPENVVARTGRAEILKALNRLPDALDAYEAVIADFPADVVARNGRAEVLKALNRLPDALVAYEAVIADFPENGVSRNGRAEVLKALNRLPDALAAYEAVIADFPSDVVGRNGRAEVLKTLNRLSDALAAYEAVIADFPENVVARTGRAEVLKALNRLPDALAAYETVIADFPENVVTRTGRAEVLKALNRLPDALDAYEAVIAEFPENVVARSGRAEVLKVLNRLPDALAAYEAVIAEFPADVVTRNGRAEVLKALNRLPDALTSYEAVIADFPSDVVARSGRAEVLKALNRLPDALAAYEAVIADFPADMVARNGCAGVLSALGRFDEALAMLPGSVATPVTKDEWTGFHIRAMVLLQMGRTEESARLLRKGLSECPRPAQRAYFQTGLALAQIRQRAFSEAGSTLEGLEEAELAAPAAALSLHAYGAAGNKERASRAAERLTAFEHLTGILEISRELRRRFLAGSGPPQTDDWLLRHEANLLVAVSDPF